MDRSRNSPKPSPPKLCAPARRFRVVIDDARSPSEIAEILGIDVEAIEEIDAARELAFTELNFLALDCETTGLDAQRCSIIELGYALFSKGTIVREFDTLCSTQGELDEDAQRITGLTLRDLDGAPSVASLLPALAQEMSRADFIVAYNVPFDRAFLQKAFSDAGLTMPTTPWIDSLVIVRELDRYKPGKNLDQAAKRWGVERQRAHRALPDAKAAGHLLLHLAPFIPIRTLEELVDNQEAWVERQEAERAAYLAEKKRRAALPSAKVDLENPPIDETESENVP